MDRTTRVAKAITRPIPKICLRFIIVSSLLD